MFLFIYIGFEAIFNSAQGLLLAECSRINPGMGQGTIWVMGIELRSRCIKGKHMFYLQNLQSH